MGLRSNLDEQKQLAQNTFSKIFRKSIGEKNPKVTFWSVIMVDECSPNPKCDKKLLSSNEKLHQRSGVLTS